MTDSKKQASKKETSKDEGAPASKEATNQATAPELELGGSRLLGGPTSDDLNPAYAAPKDEGKDKD